MDGGTGGGWRLQRGEKVADEGQADTTRRYKRGDGKKKRLYADSQRQTA